MDRALTEYTPETEAMEADEFGAGETEVSGEGGQVLGEADEMELAAHLLEVTDEQELDRFLGNLLQRAGQAVGRFASSPTGQALGGILKGAARQALPIVGKALGGYIGGERGAQLGTQAASAAGRIFGLELEGLSPEDKEFEVARNFVRFAAEAAKNAAGAPPGAPPQAVARSAVVEAAQRYAPGLLRAGPPSAALPNRVSSGRSAGRWIRRGRNIVIVNC